MLAMQTNEPFDAMESVMREKCALALISRYMHSNLSTTDNYEMTTPSGTLITLPYAVTVLDAVVDKL